MQCLLLVIWVRGWVNFGGRITAMTHILFSYDDIDSGSELLQNHLGMGGRRYICKTVSDRSNVNVKLILKLHLVYPFIKLSLCTQRVNTISLINALDIKHLCECYRPRKSVCSLVSFQSECVCVWGGCLKVFVSACVILQSVLLFLCVCLHVYSSLCWFMQIQAYISKFRDAGLISCGFGWRLQCFRPFSSWLSPWYANAFAQSWCPVRGFCQKAKVPYLSATFCIFYFLQIWGA